MSERRLKVHPTLGILVCTDGSIVQPGDKWHKTHVTFGTKAPNGYMNVCINYKNHSIHELVLDTFVGPCPEGYERDHINRDRSDNRLENLRYVTKSENQRNTSKHDRCEARLGVHSYEDRQEYNKRNCHDWYMRHRDEINTKRRAEDKTEINKRRRERYAANREFYCAKLREYRHKKKEEAHVEL